MEQSGFRWGYGALFRECGCVFPSRDAPLSPIQWLDQRKIRFAGLFSVGMGNPDLRFTLHSVLLGHLAMSIVYLRENDIRVIDTMELDENGLTARMIACYSGGNTRV